MSDSAGSSTLGFRRHLTTPAMQRSISWTGGR